MQCCLVGADAPGLAYAVGGHHAALHVLGAAGEELEMLRVEFPPKLAFLGVEREKLTPLLPPLLLLEQPKQLPLFR